MTTNYELKTLADKLQLKLSLTNIIMQGDLHKIKPRKNMNLIINLDDSVQKNGTHWVCIYKIDNHVCYYDSFAAIPPKCIYTWCKLHHFKLGINSYICQNINDDSCGIYCVMFLHYINSHKNIHIYEAANQYVNLFVSNTIKNKGILMKYKKLELKSK